MIKYYQQNAKWRLLSQDKTGIKMSICFKYSSGQIIGNNLNYPPSTLWHINWEVCHTIFVTFSSRQGNIVATGQVCREIVGVVYLLCNWCNSMNATEKRLTKSFLVLFLKSNFLKQKTTMSFCFCYPIRNKYSSAFLWDYFLTADWYTFPWRKVCFKCIIFQIPN